MPAKSISTAHYIYWLIRFNKRFNTKAAARGCSAAVLKNQKQPLADFFKIGALKNFAIFRGKHFC